MMNRQTLLWTALLGTCAQGAEAPVQSSDRLLLRRHLRGLGREGSPAGEVPKGILEALDRLALSDVPRAHAWKAVRDFLTATAVEDTERSMAMMRTRRALAPGERTASNLAQWEIRAAALMDLARSGRLADDVYQEARRSLEEELRKALSIPRDGEKPFPRTVDEAARLVLDLLEPELKDPKDLPAPLREEVARLVARLGDREWDAREAATERLLEIGEPALGALRPALDHPDLEVRERVRVAWRVILGGKR